MLPSDVVYATGDTAITANDLGLGVTRSYIPRGNFH